MSPSTYVSKVKRAGTVKRDLDSRNSVNSAYFDGVGEKQGEGQTFNDYFAYQRQRTNKKHSKGYLDQFKIINKNIKETLGDDSISELQMNSSIQNGSPTHKSRAGLNFNTRHDRRQTMIKQNTFHNSTSSNNIFVYNPANPDFS